MFGRSNTSGIFSSSDIFRVRFRALRSNFDNSPSISACFFPPPAVFLFAGVDEHHIFGDLAFFFNFEYSVVLRGDIVDSFSLVAFERLILCLIQRMFGSRCRSLSCLCARSSKRRLALDLHRVFCFFPGVLCLARGY